MKSILTLKDYQLRSFLSKPLNIRPKIKGVRVCVKIEEGNCSVFRNDSDTKIDELVLCINTIYENAMNHFSSVKVDRKTDDLFLFDYFPDETFNEEYRPNKSLLYLNSIRKGTYSINEELVLKKWSHIFNTDYIKPFFSGVLNEDQREGLIKAIFTNSAQKFIEQNFNSSFKITDIIFSSKEEDYKLSLEQSYSQSNHNTDYNQIIISEFSNYINENSLIGSTKLEVLENYFLSFLSEKSKLIEGIEYNTDELFGHSRYKINTKLISNIDLINLLIDNTVYENLYQVILGYYSKPFKRPKGLIDNATLENLNKSIKKIENLKQNNKMKTYKELKKSTQFSSIRVHEGLTLHTRQQGEEEVNIMVGRFQPFTNGHVKVAEQIHKSNGLPVVILAVNSGKVTEKTPFTTSLLEESFIALQGEFSFLQDLLFIKNASIDQILNELRPEYEPVLLGCGEDRYDSYNYMINKYRAEANLLSKFTLDKVERQDSDVSATQVRAAIEANNKEEFEELTPSSLHSLWDEYRKEIVPEDKEETSESLAILHNLDEEFIKKSIRKGILLEKRKRRKKNSTEYYSKLVMRNLKYRPFFYGGGYITGLSNNNDLLDGGDVGDGDGGGASESLSTSFIHFKEDFYSIPRIITDNLRINEQCQFKINAIELIKEGIVLDENGQHISSFRNKINDKETILKVYGLEHLIRKVNSLGDAKNSSNFYEVLFEKMIGGSSGNIKGQSDSIFYDVQVMNEFVSVKSSSSARTAYNTVLNKSVTKLNQYYNFILNKGLNLNIKDRVIENSLKILIERLSKDKQLLTWLNDREYGILHYIIESSKIEDIKSFDFEDFIENFKYEVINIPDMSMSIAAFFYPTVETLSYRKTSPSSLSKINKGLNKIILERMQEDKASNKLLFLTSRKSIDCLFEDFDYHSIDFVFSPVEHESIIEMKKTISRTKAELIYLLRNDPDLQINGESIFNEDFIKKIIISDEN